MATFLVAHGAWSAGWAWKKMRPLLQERGHVLHTPTYTGLGERAHLASRDVTLQTHIADVLGTLEFEDLRDVVLVGHSYGGMVATGVADRARVRLRCIVYLDAFVPRDGQSLLDLLPAEMRERMREAARTSGEGWRVPPNPVPPDTSEADLAWLAGLDRISIPPEASNPDGTKTWQAAAGVSGSNKPWLSINAFAPSKMAIVAGDTAPEDDDNCRSVFRATASPSRACRSSARATTMG